jgi:uncharacterized membrane protein YkvA (DUF1232 family)
MARYTVMRSLNSVRKGWGLFKNKKTLWQMLKEIVNGRYRMSFYTHLVLLLGLVYIIFPFDLIPDGIPVIGWIDDGFVVFLLVRRLNAETMRFIRYKAMERRHGDILERISKAG